MLMGRKVFADISKQALIHNIQRVNQVAPNSKVLAMVKANAYGHGIVSVAKTLTNADAFGVANIEEALLLRQAGIKQPIVLMEGFFESSELDWLIQYQLTPVIHHFDQIDALVNYHSKETITVWVKINTGMNRLGFSPEQFGLAYQKLIKIPGVEIIGFMTHFPQADETENPLTDAQTQLFLSLTKDLPGQKCLANSAAILAWPKTHFDWVRPGLMLYGASPFLDKTAQALQLKPVMQLSAEIIAIQNVKEGQRVGYGGQWQSASDSTKVGVVSIGYGDGYPWHAKTGTPVLVNGQSTQLLGRVSMDMIAVDLTHLASVKVGDPVELWGAQLPIEQVAISANTIPYELFCRLTDRVSVRIVD